MEKSLRELEHSDFDKYPHYIFATAFLVDGKLADFEIGNRESCWGLRTFRGTPWENEVWKHGFIIKDWNLTCEYKKILVKDDEEHNKVFDILENWLLNGYELYEKANLRKW